MNVTILLSCNPGDHFTKSDVGVFGAYPDALATANVIFDVDAARGDAWHATEDGCELVQDGEVVAKLITQALR
jgi:hypothetical protein